MTELDVSRGSVPDYEPGAVAAFGSQQAPQTDLSQVFWRGRWIILLCAALGLGAGFFYLSKATPIYSSSSRLYVESERPIISGSDPLTGQSQSGNWLITQAELIKSSQILGPVADEPEVRAMKTFAGMDSPLGLLKARTTAMVGQKDDLITIAFESPEKEEAASVVNAIVQAYKTYYAGRKRSNAVEVLRILQKEQHERETELSQKLAALLEFKQQNPDLSYSGEKGNIIIEQLSKLSDALTTARLEALNARGVYEATKAMADDPAKMDQWIRLQPEDMNNPLRAELQRLEIQMVSLRQNQGAANPAIRTMQVQVEELRQRIEEQSQRAVAGYVAAVEQRWQTARQREEELQKSFSAQQKQALALNTAGAQLGTREAEVKRLERLCDMLDSRMKEIKVTEDTGAMNISVLEYARPAGMPIRPQRSTVLFEAMVAGLLAGAGLAFLRSRMDHRFASAEEVHNLLGLTVLGVVPHMLEKETPSARGQKVQLEPMSEVAEAFRTVRTSVYFGVPDGKARTLLVTSPTPGDGKTTSASNLAIAMAQAGQRVLLLDADFRKPMQHKVFGIDDGIGLMSVMNGQVPLGKAIKPTATRGLYVLPCGPIPANPSEILISRTFAAVLSKLKEKFDHVVIDSAPVMPVTDSRILGAGADLTILVLRAGKSSRKLSRQAVDSLTSVGSRVLGVVVNDVSRGQRYGYDGYGYYYGYGRRGAKDAIDVRANGNGHAAAAQPALEDGVALSGIAE